MSEINRPIVFKMNWHKVLTHFLLFLIAAFFLCNGILYISGYVYISEGFTWDRVYAFYDANTAIQTLDIAYGVLCMIIALALFLTRFFLVKFHHLAPTMLLIVPIVGGVVSIAYTLAAYAATADPISGAAPFCICMFVIVAVFTLANRIYYAKRDNMFYN